MPYIGIKTADIDSDESPSRRVSPANRGRNRDRSGSTTNVSLNFKLEPFDVPGKPAEVESVASLLRTSKNRDPGGGSEGPVVGTHVGWSGEVGERGRAVEGSRERGRAGGGQGVADA